LADVVRASTSGEELRARGYSSDVDAAVQFDVSAVAPRLADGAFSN
jgi:phosphosulfolactate phosphohydrolase-like enzyme